MPTDDGEGRSQSCRPVAREASDHEPPRGLCPRCGARVALAAGGTGPAAQPEIKSATLRARLHRFEAYTPTAVARRLLHGLREALVTSAVECRATVMFTDVAGFTALTEGWPPAAVAAFLNDHFALVAGGIEAEGGTVGTFLGDGVMSFWTAAGHEDHALRAARAALRIARAVLWDNGRRTARGEAPVRLRIGVHTGPVILGPIGSPSRVTRTVVGDTVNVAQRLEQFAKELPTDGAAAGEVTILVGDGTAADLGGCFPLHPVGRVRLRGRQEGADAFQIRADGWMT